MKIKRCLNCGDKFYPNVRVSDQKFCSKKECQQARKNQWLRHKIKHDVEYKQSKIVSQSKWETKKQKQRQTKGKAEYITSSKIPMANLTQYKSKNQKLNIVIPANLLTQFIRKKEIKCKLILE
jgi:hypothetical protein